jgi:hypothetical protein
MRMLKIGTGEYINLDAIAEVTRNTDGIVSVWFSDSKSRAFLPEQSAAIWEIITRGSTDLNELVELRQAQQSLNADVPF